MATAQKAVTVDKLSPADWQCQDLAELCETQRTSTANWSDMGCYKTSTALWLIDYKLKDIAIPRILIVTTKSGKGTYFQNIPRCMDRYHIINCNTQSANIVVHGKEVKLGKHLAQEIAFPHIVVTHYDVFSKSNKGKMEKCPSCKGTGSFSDSDFFLPCPKCEGKKNVLKPWTQADYLLAREWDFVVLDEAHRIKNKDTKWSVNLKKVKSTYRHVMTGTGFINRPDEIWSLLNFLNKQQFSSYWGFRETYCLIDDWDGYAKVVGIKPSMKKQFRNIVRQLGPRRTKLEVFPHLTEPIYQDIMVDLNVVQRRMFDEIKNELYMLDQKGEPINSPNVLSQLNRMRQISVATPEVISDVFDEKQQRRVIGVKLVEPSSKLDALMEIIEGLQWDEDAKQQIVVFSCFRDPLEMLKVRLDAAKVSYIHMQQKDNDQQRYQKWAVDFPKQEHQVFMSTLQLGSESISLTSAQYIAFLDMSWSPKDNEQGVSRVWRPGQLNTPVVIKFHARNSSDQRIYDTNQTKLGWFKEIFGVEEADGTGT